MEEVVEVKEKLIIDDRYEMSKEVAAMTDEELDVVFKELFGQFTED